MSSFEEELRVCAKLECSICGNHRDFVFDKNSLNDFITKQKVREVFDGLLIGFQEEATSLWSSEIERKVWGMAYRDVVNKLKELCLEDE